MIDVQFIGSEGWAVGYSSTVENMPSTILYSSDSGKNWNPQNSGTKVMLMSVHFINSKVGWAVGHSSYILHTTNGGKNWISEQAWGDVRFHCITFTDENTGWIVGDDHLNNELVLYKTTNGGIKWEKNVLDLPCYSLTDICFTDVNNGWISASYPSYILRTTNGGLSWTVKDLGLKESVNSLYFINENEGWAVGGYYERGVGSSTLIIHTTDGGENWETQSVGRTFYLNDVIFVDNQHGWAVGGAPAISCGKYSSYIISTSDGGVSWEEQYIPVYCDLAGLFIDDDLNGWAVGVDNFGGGCILYSGLNITESSTGINDEINNDFTIYPNPADDYIVLPEFAPLSNEITILTVTGHIVYKKPAIRKIDVRFLSPGLYFLKIGDEIKKLVKL